MARRSIHFEDIEAERPREIRLRESMEERRNMSKTAMVSFHFKNYSY